MGFDILRCKSPDMIERELWMHLIAYNLVRALMHCAATTHRAPLDRVSFKCALHTLARDLLPHRPNRCQPRARKRRPKNYPLLTKPRHLFVEIQHRNRYKKALT